MPTPRSPPYPFTTKIPNLGVMKVYDRQIVIADIPGIIEGASRGAGLGFQFLRHISRTFLIVFLIDLEDEAFLDSVRILKQDWAIIRKSWSARHRSS